jgi:hypothetical protein
VITLLPKLADANKIQQFQLICLLRLDPYATKFFSVQQNTFIKKLNITDDIMSLHELDFEKAYDKVNQNFLLDCHKVRGFSEYGVIGNTKSSIMVLSLNINNVMESYFQSAKGVRQADPSSPGLFNVAGEVLTKKMVIQAQKNGLTVGLAPDLIPNRCALQYCSMQMTRCVMHYT